MSSQSVPSYLDGPGRNLASSSRSEHGAQVASAAVEVKTDKGPLVVAAVVACLASFQFGYHTGELNTPKDVFTGCAPGALEEAGWLKWLPKCIPMSELEFSVVTGMLPMGGVGGSLFGGLLMDRRGRRGALVWANMLLALGSLCMTLSVGLLTMTFGRLLVGIAGGISLVVVPAYLAEVAPVELRGTFGVCSQFMLVSGIVVSQSLGLAYADISRWRAILAVGTLVSLIQALGLPSCPESPWFLFGKPGHVAEAERVLKKLRGHSEIEAEISERGPLQGKATVPNYGTIPADEPSSGTLAPLSLVELCKSKHYRHGLLMLLFLHLTQQLSGINAIMYYSTTILRACQIGHRPHQRLPAALHLCRHPGGGAMGAPHSLILSSGAMGLFSALLAWAINGGYPTLSAIALFMAVGSFALGLGPLPFLLASELLDSAALGAASALGLTTNLAFNFGVAAAFLPVSAVFPAGQPGSIFFTFSGWLLISALVFYRLFPETRAASPQANLAALSAKIRSLFA
ncbi:hypothetical protein L0F63_005416 [Massospora cicadina]|nr:hypothetical protein L0F63_005416 [Massospora cicadina]